jgi:hypothetical protein
VELFDNNTFNAVKKGLFNYIRKNPYIQKLNQIRKKDLKELIGQTTHEISKLDSLQDEEYFRDKGQPALKESQLSILTPKETQLYYKDKLSLVSKKLVYDKELELSTEPITVIKDFTSLTEAVNTLSKYLKKYGLAFLILGLIVLVFIEYRKPIMKIFQEG